MLTGGQDSLANDIKGFLQRPVHIRSFTWNSGQGPLTELMPKVSLPSEFIQLGMINEKLRGFRYLRCDFVVEVQFNAQPFNAGAAILWLNPLGDQLLKQPSSTYHLGGLTGYPNVIYKCGDATKVRFRMPFYGLISHYDLCSGVGSLGSMHLSVLSQLTGSADVDGTVFLWAENIDISMPTGQPMRSPPTLFVGAAQSGIDQSGSPTEGGEPAAEMQTERPSRVSPAKKDGTMMERAKKERWVSTGLGAVSTFAASLSVVPSLTAFAKLSAGVFSQAANVAKFYGWSKPLDTECAPSRQLAVARHMQNANGDSKAKVMALDANICCDVPTEVFGTDEDEMAYRTILNRAVFTDSFQWTQADGSDKILWSWPVDPLWCKQQEVDISGMTPMEGTQCQSTYLSYLAMNAAFWRGAIEYRIEAIKTVFHSGRLRVTFVPGATLLSDFSTIDYNKCYSEIFDLREQGTMHFKVPFTWNQPWKDTITTLRPDGTFSVAPTGMIYVSVINALRNPTTAANSVELIVFTKAGDDFQLAFPQVRDDFRINRSTPIKPPIYSGPAQSGIYSCNENIGFDPNALAIGEAFTGFRQWLKRYHAFSNADLNSNLDLQLPFRFSADKVTNTPPQELAIPVDAFDVASELYRFKSGSLRTLHVRDPSLPFTASITPGNVPIASRGGPISVSAPTLEPIVELAIPFYQRWPAILTDTGHPILCDGNVSTGFFRDMPYNDGTFEMVGPTSYESYQVFRAAGEDFSFGCLLGPPIVTLVRPG